MSGFFGSSRGAEARVRAEWRSAVVGGAIVGIALVSVAIGVGWVQSFQALRLIAALLPTARFLAAAVLGGGVTVLALLLTLIGLSLGSQYEFNERLFSRTRNISRLAVASIIGGSVVLMAVTIPIETVEEVRTYYVVLYYVLVFSLAILSGIIVALGLLIGSTVAGLIDVVHPEGSSEFLEPGGSDEVPLVREP